MKLSDAKLTLSLHSTDCGEYELEELQVWLTALLSFVRQRQLRYTMLAQRMQAMEQEEIYS